ncbi:MAG: HlyD family efflux transporter periplasmic adaptor subunit [Pseudomonadota bacterium]
MKRLAFLALGLLAAAGLLTLIGPFGGSGDHATTARAQATEGSLPPPQRHSIVALGEILPLSDIILVSGPTGQDPGVIEKITVAEGDRVLKGDVLAVLDTRGRLAAALDEAKATVQLKQSELERLRADLDSEEARLQAELKQQQAERDRAEWDYEKSQRLTAAGVYNETAQIDKRLALESLNREVETSRIALERIQTRNAAGVRLDEMVAQADLLLAQAAALRADADYQRAFIHAPIDGRVLRLIARDGQQIVSDGFAEIGETETMLVRTEVFESDIPFVFAGQRADITARPLAQPLTGVVERVGFVVATQSIVSGDPAANLDARVVEAWIRLDAASSARVADMSGLQVRVVLPLNTLPDA